MITRAVTCLSYGNALHYGLFMLNWEKMYGNALHCGLSIFAEFEKFPFPSVIPISVRLNMLLHITKLYKHG